MSCHRNIGLYQRPKGHTCAWLFFRRQPGETDFQSMVRSRSPEGLERIGLFGRSICRTQLPHGDGNSSSLSRFGRFAYPDSREMA